MNEKCHGIFLHRSHLNRFISQSSSTTQTLSRTCDAKIIHADIYFICSYMCVCCVCAFYILYRDKESPPTAKLEKLTDAKYQAKHLCSTMNWIFIRVYHASLTGEMVYDGTFFFLKFKEWYNLWGGTKLLLASHFPHFITNIFHHSHFLVCAQNSHKN